MVKTLDIGIRIPLDIVTDTNAILAKKGAGKTYTGSVLAEEMIALGQRVVIVDPTNAWWGLRAKADGSPGGLPVVIFGGDHGDYPLDENMGGLIADLIVDGKVGSCILVTKGFESDASRVRFLLTLGQRLFFRNREPLHLFLDEADDYLPQTVTGDVAKLVNVWARIVKQGRLQGLGVTMITQRAAVLNKNVLTQISTLFVLQTVGPQDIDAIADFVRAKGGSHKEMLEALPRLKKGDVYVYSPEFLGIDPPQLHHIRERRTFNSSATPKVGERRIEPKALAKVDVEKLREALAVTIEKAKADDPKFLRTRIADLEKQLARAKMTPVDVSARPMRVEVPVEVPVVDDVVLTEFNIAAERMHKAFEEIRIGLRKYARSAPRAARPEPTRAPVPRTPVAATITRGVSGELSRCERAILTVLAQERRPCSRDKIAVVAGYRLSGSFDQALASLRSRGAIEGDGSGNTITEAGLVALGSWEERPTGAALLSWWCGRVSTCERAILTVLAEPSASAGITREGLAARAGYKLSGSFDQALASLRTMTLIEGPGGRIVLSKELR